MSKTFPGKVRGTADPSTALGGCDFFNFPCSLWPESSEEHLPTSIAGVLRLRAINPLLCDRSARRFAPTARRGRQDDAFLEGTKQHLVGCKKHEKIEKVTGSLNEQTKSVVPHLRRSTACLWTQPFRAGLTFGGRPSGPGLQTPLSHVHSILNLPQASQLLPRHAGAGGMTKGRGRFHGERLPDRGVFHHLGWAAGGSLMRSAFLKARRGADQQIHLTPERRRRGTLPGSTHIYCYGRTKDLAQHHPGCKPRVRNDHIITSRTHESSGRGCSRTTQDDPHQKRTRTHLSRNHVIIALEYAGLGIWDASKRSGAWGSGKAGNHPRCRWQWNHRRRRRRRQKIQNRRSRLFLQL